MKYRASVAQFRKSKMFDSRGEFRHLTTSAMKLFPYTTSTGKKAAPVLHLQPLVGSFLCRIEQKRPVELTCEKLVEALKEETSIQPGQEELFSEMIRQLFFTSDGSIRPLNLQMIEQIPCTDSESKLADYLVDVLGEPTALRKSQADAHSKTSSNVLEALVLSKLKFENQPNNEDSLRYFRVVASLKDSFEEDFAYVVEDPGRLREYLVTLLEWYYFSYTAQTILQLNRFLDGERYHNVPLYFCLEWEKTSQNRLCYTDGWKKLQSATEKIFAHTITLQILNQTEEGSDLVDYIRLHEIVSEEKTDQEVSEQIDLLTELYRTSVHDKRNRAQKEAAPSGKTAASVQYLFDSIREHFFETDDSPCRSYAKKFERYCDQFLKSRGRSGKMLNLSEENLIFLTKLCIKNQERLRLNEVFQALEDRGVFLDDNSKEQAIHYYEKLNLIEKKSDSGDAMYVKRIL